MYLIIRATALQMSAQIVKLMLEYVKYDCHQTSFHDTCACCKSFCTELLYQISRKSDKLFSRWH